MKQKPKKKISSSKYNHRIGITLTADKRCALALAAFNVACEEFEVFNENHLGIHLAYLMGAILDPKGSHYAYVDWSLNAMAEKPLLFDALRDHFPEDSPLWNFIQL